MSKRVSNKSHGGGARSKRPHLRGRRNLAAVPAPVSSAPVSVDAPPPVRASFVDRVKSFFGFRRS